MKKLLIPILFFSYFLCTSSSCKKNPSMPAAYNTEFPNNIGTWWKYKIYDLIYLTTDTTIITVVGNTKLDNGTDVTIWRRNSLLNGTDSLFVDNKPEGIKIYSNKLASAYPIKRYVLPFSVGNYWTTQNVLDTNRVTLKGDTTVLAGMFINAFKLIRDSRIPPGLNVIKENEWFAPNIGTVFREYQAYGSGTLEGYRMELVSYLIK